MVNHLSDATSPYLLQHAANPVDWWEWGSDAFAEAADRDVPVLLSVGYASCHWCHVMAHESFEDEETARVMNELFVNIKVDREERPDVDRIYMDAVQSMTGQGGWPMTVFLTPRGEPFFAGTYFPREDRHGHPSFRRVMEGVHDAWISRRTEVEAQAETLAETVAVRIEPGESIPGSSELSGAYQAVRAAFDPVHGGFGGAPKFPQASVLEFLLRAAGKPWAPEAENMLTHTLHTMADGGIHDQIGGGFSRYAVDHRWLVPHFEKMLYDNALLARLYALAWQVTGIARFADVARSTLEYMLRDLELADGGFASGEDADSEGEEGRFYVYSWDEFSADAAHEAVADVLGATPGGNFEGSSIVHRHRPIADVAAERGEDPAALEEAVTETLGRLSERRSHRVRPGLDDKSVCAWNGLAVRAFAEAGVVLEDPTYIGAAIRTARFVLDHLRRPDGRLMRSVRAGRTSVPAFCDDYGAVAVGLFALYQATGDPEWYSAGAEITREMIDLFWDDDAGGFFATGRDAERLIARPKNLFDNPTPSDNSLAAEALQHLAALSGDSSLLEHLERVFRAGAPMLQQYPLGAGHLLAALLVAQAPPLEIAIVGSEEARPALEAVLRTAYRPHVFVAVGSGEDDHGVPLLAGRQAIAAATAYVCRGFVCDAPVTTATSLMTALDRGTAPA